MITLSSLSSDFDMLVTALESQNLATLTEASIHSHLFDEERKIISRRNAAAEATSGHRARPAGVSRNGQRETVEHGSRGSGGENSGCQPAETSSGVHQGKSTLMVLHVCHCFWCGSSQHLLKACPQKKKKPSGGGAATGGLQATLVTTDSAEATFWLWDLGASQHFCKSKDLLWEAQPSGLQHVSLADGSNSQVVCEGKVQFPALGYVLEGCCVFHLLKITSLAKVL